MAAGTADLTVTPQYQPGMLTEDHTSINSGISPEGNEKTPLISTSRDGQAVQGARPVNLRARARWHSTLFKVNQVALAGLKEIPFPDLLESALVDLQREELEAIEARRKELAAEVAVARKDTVLNLIKVILAACAAAVAYYYWLGYGNIAYLTIAILLSLTVGLNSSNGVTSFINWRRLAAGERGLPLGGDAIGNLGYLGASYLTDDEGIRSTTGGIASLLVNETLRLGTGVVSSSTPAGLINATDVLEKGDALLKKGEQYIGQRIKGLDITLEKLTKLKRITKKERFEADQFRERFETLYEQYWYHKLDLNAYRHGLIKLIDDVKVKVSTLRVEVRDDYQLAKKWGSCWDSLPEDTKKQLPELKSIRRATRAVLHPHLDDDAEGSLHLLGIDPASLSLHHEDEQPYVEQAEKDIAETEAQIDQACAGIQKKSVHYAGRDLCFQTAKTPFAIAGFLGLGAAAYLTVGLDGIPVMTFMLGNAVIAVLDLEKAFANYFRLRRGEPPLPIGKDSIGLGFYESLKLVGVGEQSAKSWGTKAATLVRYLFNTGASATQSDVMDQIKQVQKVADAAKPLLEKIDQFEQDQKQLDKEESELQLKLQKLDLDLKGKLKGELKATSQAHREHIQNIRRVASIKINVQMALMAHYIALKEELPDEIKAFKKQFIADVNGVTPTTTPEVIHALKKIFHSLPKEAQDELNKTIDVIAKLESCFSKPLEPQVETTDS
ncbi:hypothetical protein [Parashewanella tropica]|uniref:hypothetical protein n=1 Tax=Parashewanella tropica TaxID=2547970 RepID=UPI00105A3F28|nr:hypothetical protein [Parashewanella tropica]